MITVLVVVANTMMQTDKGWQPGTFIPTILIPDQIVSCCWSKGAMFNKSTSSNRGTTRPYKRKKATIYYNLFKLEKEKTIHGKGSQVHGESKAFAVSSCELE